MSSFKNFLRYNNKNVVPTLEAMQRMIDLYHDKDIDMLKLGCNLPNLVNICLHKSTDAKFYPFAEGDKDFLRKNSRRFCWWSICRFYTQSSCWWTFVRKSSDICKSFVGIHASQLYHSSMCQPMPTGLYTRWDLDSETGRFTLDRTRPAASKIWSCPISNEQYQNVKLKASLQQEDGRELTASVLMGFVLIATLCMKPWVAFTTSVLLNSSAHLSLTKVSNAAVGKENSMNWEEAISGRKVSLSLKCGNVSGGDFTRQPIMINYITVSFPYRRSLIEHQLLEGIKKGNLFDYVQCDIKVPKKLRANLAKFLSIFRNTWVNKNDTGDLMKTYAEEEGLMSQLWKMLISSFTLQNGTLITHLLLFYLQLGILVTKSNFLLSTLRRNVSTALYRQQWTQEGKVTKIETQVLSQKQWSF